jgi:predicted ATPase
VAGVIPDRDPRAEVVHESAHTRVTRLFLPGRTLIRKEPLGSDAQRRLRHERAMLERLQGVPGVAQLLDAPRYPGAILMADVGGTSLAGRAGKRQPLAIDELIGLAVRLAEAVVGMHRRGVMHRDICPANIVLSRDGTPCLVDFALATSVAEIRPEFTHPSEIVGTLAYLAPEQTGRTGRSVDQRADLYALGATLYELATGGPPFGSGDPLRLTHDHLARVAVPPAQVNPAVPAPLSEIVLHLLEKEPDNRYQTAEGLLHDLQRLCEAQEGPAVGPVRIGEHDVPSRLLPPSRLVGRDDEVTALEEAFKDALAGRCHAVLLGGAPGVGKTALVDQLRPVVTGSDGWFLAGKFDQYRRDLEFDAVYQAFRALGRLLLAEPDDELAQVRTRILAGVGANAGLLTATVPEFAALLAVPPDAGDPLTAQVRAQRNAVEVLRAVASRKRPVVLFLDDLQWAGRSPLGVVDLVLGEEPVEGLLLVCAYREGDVDAEIDPAHPPAARLTRWREQAAVQQLRLENLPRPSLVGMVAEMLHADAAAVAGLVEVIEPHTSGNPYETVELLNALRRDGVLAATADGWRWDHTAARAHLGQADAAGLLAARVAAIPAPSRRLVEAMACLGGRAELGLLETATATSASAVEGRLAPVLDDGLLVVEPGAQEAVRFRHDRIREVILGGLDPRRRRALQLAMARRLAGVPESYAVAAEQYLPVVDAVDDVAERRQVVRLLRRAGDQAALVGDYALVDALLSAALRLIDPGDTRTLIAVHTGRHAALFSLGRLDEADDVYRTIDRLCTTAMQRADATCVQAMNLTYRKRFAEAVLLGVESLRELGVTVPAADQLTDELDRQFDHLYRWLDQTDAADDLARPDVSEPTLLATARLLNAILPAAYLAPDPVTHAWLSLQAVRIWLEHGPSRSLLGPAGIAAFAAVALRGDYAAAYRALRRFLAIGEACGYEPETSQTRFLFSIQSWSFEPIENAVRDARRARAGLIAGGDNVYAGYTFYTTLRDLLDCAPSLDDVVAEIETGLAFMRRTGSEYADSLGSYMWLADVLRGEGRAAFGEALAIDRHADNPLAILHAHICRAIAATILGDPVALDRHGRPGQLPERRGPRLARNGPGRAGPHDGSRRARPSAVRTG